ncbi:MAG: hypothetical protein R3C03_05455 [Pirellulaceae bacterium]
MPGANNGQSPLFNEIKIRQILLTYDQDQDRSLKQIIQHLNLQFNHEREIPPTERNLPSSLDPSRLDVNSLISQALKSHTLTDHITDAGLVDLIGRFEELREQQRSHLLGRWQYPDEPKLVKWIADDMTGRFKTSFGSMAIHSQLTLKQMDELAGLVPELLGNGTFIELYCRKLRPSDDVNILSNDAEALGYLNRIWKFVQPLDPAHNSLKACVLFNILRLEHQQGDHNLERFKSYLSLPRNVYYLNANVARVPDSRFTANTQADFSQTILLPSIGDESELVLSLLDHFLADAKTPQEFAPYFEENFLAKQFAISKIVRGDKNVEQWISRLGPAEYSELINRVEIRFASTNQKQFSVDESVKLEVEVKNVNELLVNIFEINTDNVYRLTGQEVNTDIELDGLVPNWQQRKKLKNDPAIRQSLSFEFPELDHRGVYIVDFIGNGRSSRALIRKGRLDCFTQVTASGMAVTVFDELGDAVDNASLWLNGRVFEANDKGKILIPFSTAPGQHVAIVRHNGFAERAPLTLVGEDYQFSAGFFFDREALLRNRSAKLVVRPALTVAGVTVPITGILEKSSLTVNFVNKDGNRTTKTVSDLKLDEREEFALDLQVPAEVEHIEMNLQGEIFNESRNERQTVASSDSFHINAIDRTNEVADLHLLLNNNEFNLEVLGRNGERLPAQVVELQLQHELVTQPIVAVLQSDPDGRIYLGDLPFISSVSARIVNRGSQRQWAIDNMDHRNRYSTYTGQSGEPIFIPVPFGYEETDRSWLGLYALRSGVICEDMFDAAQVHDGLVFIKSLPAGDYRMVFKATGENLLIRVTDGKNSGTLVHGEARRWKFENRFRWRLKISKSKMTSSKSSSATHAPIRESTFLQVDSCRDLMRLQNSMFAMTWSQPRSCMDKNEMRLRPAE